MTDSKQPGLVKSLLFPAYADAGSNENFQASDGAVSESDATTTVHDNTTASKPQQHEMQYDGDRVGGYAPASLDDSLLTQTGATESIPKTDDDDTAQQQQLPSAGLPPPQSLGPRSASTTTNIGIRPFPTTSPRISTPTENNAMNQSLEYSSITATSSAAVSSVVGVNFLNESREQGGSSNDEEREEEDDEPTPIKDNRRSAMNLNDDVNLFQPRLADLEGNDASSDVFSDINSNASEMGTVINASGGSRLAEVQAMAAYMEKNNTGTGSPLYESESGASDIPKNANDVPELSLPTLEKRRNNTNPESSPSRSSVFREKMDSVFRERGGTSTPPPPPEDSSPSSATAMVSAAIRRLGSGVGNLNRPQAHHGPHSAPTTPRVVVPPSPRVEHYLRSSLSSSRPTNTNEQSSAAYLLRSPGSAVHFQPDGSKRQGSLRLAPRFSRSHEVTSADNNRAHTLRHANSLASPLRFARGCLSFDNTVEHRPFASRIPENQPTSPLTHHLRPRASSQSPVKQSRSWDVTSATSSMNTQGREPRTPTSYRSFAFGKSPESSTAGAATKSTLSAFRPAPLTRVRHANGLSLNTTARPTERYGAQALNDISPAVAKSRAQDTLALRTPQRIEIERDDALDILACLVERSVAFDQELIKSSQVETIQEEDENDEDAASTDVVSTDGAVGQKNESSSPADEKVELTDDDRVSTFAEIGVRDVKSPPPTRRKSRVDLLQADSFSSDLAEAIVMIRKISQDYERNASVTDISESSATNHDSRMKAVDELLRSHTYAAEMRRAAKSASTWLRSIDRLEGSSDENDLRSDLEAESQSYVSSHPGESRKQDTEQLAGELNKSEQSRSMDKMDIVALRAMLHSAELKAKEKEDTALRLNEELSKCRAEIGRLKTATRAEKVAFASPNKSILDSDDDSTSSTDVPTADNTGARELANILDDASPIQTVETDKDTSLDASFVRSDVVLEKVAEEADNQWHAIAEAKKESVLLKAALTQANETIRKLHEGTLEDGGDVADVPVVSVDSSDLSKLLDDYKEAVRSEFESKAIQTPPLQETHQDGKSVNVRMLDEENYVSEWDDLAPPLPPPPDHGLRSPIVGALLQQWTSDGAMHDSLLSWMERIMNGADCETIPPLTISALDHQVRDGFAMHVLPLLLRRSDIHVDVKTRAHRRTHYDMSVSVTSSVLQEQSANHLAARGLEASPSNDKAMKTQMMAFKASHGNRSVLDESMQADVGAPTTPYNVSDYLRTSSYAHSSSDIGSDSVAHSTTTALATNSSKRYTGESRPTRPSTAHQPAERNIDEMPGPMTRAMFGDDISTSSSTTGGSSQKSGHNPGLMGTIGGAFGGLLRRKPSEPEPFYGESGFDENGFVTDEADAVPSFLRHAPPPSSPSRSEDDGQPYHRVVSAPPGRIGVTFVDYRGHAMVSDVAAESPLSGWVFPSDILIAIDEVPVSGMRVRDIIKLLTSRKKRQRALRVISSHAMNEFTLNTTTPSEAGAPS